MDNKKRITTIAAVLALIGAVLIGCLFFMKRDEGLSATTIRIIDFIGGVFLKDDGGDITVRRNMLLHNGNVLATDDDGSIDLFLDDSKAAGLDTDSRAAFTQNGKALDISVESGALYFYTTERLGEGELFDIRTSTMLIGVRGTSGYVIYNPKNGVTKLTLTSGHVHITGTNPLTGGTNEADVYAGQTVQTYLFNYLKGKDSIQFVIKDITPDEVPALLMQKITANKQVFARVAEETGWWQEDMIKLANAAKVVNAASADSIGYAASSQSLRQAAIEQLLITAYDNNDLAYTSGDAFAMEVASRYLDHGSLQADSSAVVPGAGLAAGATDVVRKAAANTRKQDEAGVPSANGQTEATGTSDRGTATASGLGRSTVVANASGGSSGSGSGSSTSAQGTTGSRTTAQGTSGNGASGQGTSAEGTGTQNNTATANNGTVDASNGNTGTSNSNTGVSNSNAGASDSDAGASNNNTGTTGANASSAGTGDGEDTADSTDTNTSSGSSTEETEYTLTGTATVDEVNSALSAYRTVTLAPGDDGAGSLTVGPQETLTIPEDKTIVISSGVTLSNQGTINNNSDHTIDNYGVIECGEGSIINNNGRIVNNNGATISTSGTINNYSSHTIVNSGTLTCNEGSTLNNSGSFVNNEGATLENGGNFVSGGDFSNKGSIGNTVTKLVWERVSVGKGSEMRQVERPVSGTMTITGSLHNEGTVSDVDRILDVGTISGVEGTQKTSGDGWSYQEQTKTLTITSDAGMAAFIAMTTEETAMPAEGGTDISGLSGSPMIFEPYDPYDIGGSYGTIDTSSNGRTPFAGLIRSVEIKKGVTAIPANAFYNCEAIESVAIADSVTFIGEGAFSGCISLATITIPNSITAIPEGAFAYCSALEKVQLPNTVTAIGEAAFEGCEALSEVNVPSGITEIAARTFYACGALESIELPDTVKVIGDSAFSDCRSLSSFTFPAGVTTVGVDAFDSCAALESIVIPNKVTAIDGGAFAYCTALSEVTLPNTMERIPTRMFYYCKSLESIELPASVKTIGKDAFGYAGLKSIWLPDTVTALEEYAFEYAELEEVRFSPNCPEITHAAFYYCGSLKTVKLPEGVETIGEYAFGQNIHSYGDGPNTLYFPASLTKIESDAFYSCVLSAVYYAGSSKSDITIVGDGDSWRHCLTKIAWNTDSSYETESEAPVAPTNGTSGPESTTPANGTSEPENTTPMNGTSEPESTTPSNGTSEPENTALTNGTSEPENTTPANGTSEPGSTTPSNGTSEPENTAPSNGTSEPESTTPSNGTSDPENTTPSNGNSEPENTTPENTAPEGTPEGAGE